MFEIGEVVNWKIGKAEIFNRGIFFSCEGEYSTIQCMEVNGMPCRRKMPVLTSLLKKETKKVVG